MWVHSMQIAVGPSGAFAERFRVSRLIITQSSTGSTTVDCAQLGTCVLRAIDFGNGSSADVALKFNPRSRFQVSLSVDQQGTIDGGHQGAILHGDHMCETYGCSAVGDPHPIATATDLSTATLRRSKPRPSS